MTYTCSSSVQVCVIRKIDITNNLWTTDCIGERVRHALHFCFVVYIYKSSLPFRLHVISLNTHTVFYILSPLFKLWLKLFIDYLRDFSHDSCSNLKQKLYSCVQISYCFLKYDCWNTVTVVVNYISDTIFFKVS